MWALEQEQVEINFTEDGLRSLRRTNRFTKGFVPPHGSLPHWVLN